MNTRKLVVKSMNPKRGLHVKSHDIAILIEEKIFSGEFSLSEKLPSECEFCEKYGVSRTVVREAIKILNGRGLIATISGSGSTPTACPSSQLGDTLRRIICTSKDAQKNDALQLLISVVSNCAYKLAKLRKTADRRNLEVPLALMYRSVAKGREEAFLAAEVDFCRCIVGLSENIIAREIFRATENLLGEQLLRGALSVEEILARYENIFETIRQGEASPAAHLITETLHRR